LTTFTLLMIYFTATGQTSGSKNEGWFSADTLFAQYGNIQKTRPTYSYEWMDTEVKYSNASGEGVTVQNSLPRGGLGYTDPAGTRFGYAIFWTRIINETATPFELAINFPADSFAIFPQPDAYLKLFLPPDTMTVDKERYLDYGFTVSSFLDTNIHNPTKLKRTLNPKEECLFYLVVLIKIQDNGAIRTGFVLKGQDLFYKINMAWPLVSVLIPCGKISFKK
jgi:hypothetical protein